MLLLTRTRRVARTAPNEAGQDTVAVLGEIGLDGAEMKALAAEGIIHVGGPNKL